MSSHATTLRRLANGDGVSPKSTGVTPSLSTRRLNLNLPESVFIELENLADESGRTMTDIVRTGLALIAIAMDEQKAGHKLAVVEPNGKILKELVLAR